MKEYEEIKVVREMLKTVTCNKCGQSVSLKGPGDERDYKTNEFHAFNIAFGYPSKFDEERWKFDLCENCLVEFIKSFKHSPEKSYYG